MCCVKFVFVLLIITFFLVQSQCKSVKRNQNSIINPIANDLALNKTPQKSIRSKSRTVKSPSAILAIEIVDPNENSTGKSKTSKRTASSQLGYGYQDNNYFGVLNKPKLVHYKYTHDIPPYQGNYYYSDARGQDAHVQKSMQYDLGQGGQQSYQQQPLTQYYQPGTALFTTLDQNGHVNQLTSQVPQQSVNQNVPVVYLKIYSDQLSNNALYSNLPDTHPYSNLNGVNLQSLLSNYLQNNYAASNQNGQQVYNTQPQQNQQLYQAPEQGYEQGQNGDYYLSQPVAYQQNYQEQPNQYQYQQYEQPQHVAQVYHQQSTADDLPTHENYPDDAHTRVIFHSDNGGHFPEKPQAPKPNLVPSVTTYTRHIPPAQSYSSLEFKASQPDYVQNHQHQQQQQQPQQEQDEQGYYYIKPSTTNYYLQNDLQRYQPQYTEQNSQTAEQNGPYNYHAHPVGSKKRNVRRPATVSKIAKIKQEN